MKRSSLSLQGCKQPRRLVLLGCVVLTTLVLTQTAFAYQDPGKQSSETLKDSKLIQTLFTYQGQLKENGVPANGVYTFQFGLYTAQREGQRLGLIIKDAVLVKNGSFTMQLDFGREGFSSNESWLEVGVRPSSSAEPYASLSPRQRLTSTPYAILAQTEQWSLIAVAVGFQPGPDADLVTSEKIADGAVTSAKIAEGQVVKSINSLKDDVTLIAGDNVTITPGGNTLTIAAKSDAPSGADNWKLAGNPNVVFGNFLGTPLGNIVPLVIRVDGQRAFQIERGIFTGSPNIIGGSEINSVSPGVAGATIAGGGYYLLGDPNTVTAEFGTVGGGHGNQAGSHATVGGGQDNTASGFYSTVGGGAYNIASVSSSTVGGGASNTASGSYATVPGGAGNTAAGTASFAAGCGAQANYDGSFVWADQLGGGCAPFASTANNQFIVRASGGVGIGTPAPGATLHVDQPNVPNGGEAARVTFKNLTSLQSAIGVNAVESMPKNTTGSHIGVNAQTSVNIPQQQGGALARLAQASGFLDYGSILGVFGQSTPSILSTGNFPNLGPSFGVGGLFRGGPPSSSVLTLTLGTYWVGGVYGEVTGPVNGSAGRGAVAGVIGLDRNTGAATSYAGYFGGKVRVTNLPLGTTTDEVVVATTDGVLRKVAQNSIGGNAWLLNGNSNAVANISFLGTPVGTNVPLEIRVNGKRAFLIQDSSLIQTPSIIGGALYNSVPPGVGGATIAGGGFGGNPADANTVTANWGTVGGGSQNQAGTFGTVGGGFGNTSGAYSTVGGGVTNKASGNAGTVPGGELNIAFGRVSFAAGSQAQANHNGAFVWSDIGSPFASTADNQFNVRASGGTRIFSRADLGSGCILPASGNAWSCFGLKENFTPVDGRTILSKLSLISVSRWNLKGQDPTIKHLGPVAQDFYAAFGLGEDEKHISTIDLDGVALVSIQTLYQMSLEKDKKIEELQQRIETLEKLVGTIMKKQENKD